MNLKIVFEDEHIIVCYKPAGIPTQTSKLGEQDMVSLLKNYFCKKQAEDKQGGRITAAHLQAKRKEPYVAVIHRLDQPVEGLLVFAKTPFSAKELNKGLQGAGFGKHYKAVLWGVPERASATLENYLVKDGKTNTSRVCEQSEKDSKKAVLTYKLLKTGEDIEKDISLIKIKLETGRHHQIRVQMANIGCPIWGDAKYNTAPLQDKRFRQIALCAYRLEFVHPKTKMPMEFEIEPEGEGFQLIGK